MPFIWSRRLRPSTTVSVSVPEFRFPESEPVVEVQLPEIPKAVEAEVVEEIVAEVVENTAEQTEE